MKIFILILILLYLPYAWALEAGKAGESFGFSIENDARVIGGLGSDQAYSNGFKFSYVFANDHIPDWALPTLETFDFLYGKLNKTQSNFGISLGQQIFTPSDTQATNQIPDDRPYVGWLYAGAAMNLKSDDHGHFFELNVGVIGPSAMGEQVQNSFHKAINAQTAQGWDNQLSDEPGIQLSYQQRSRFLELENSSGKYFDIIPYFGAGLGNILIGAHVGGLARLGYHLTNDFGPTRPSASDGDIFLTPTESERAKHSYYLFGGIRGNATARNIFLDGNTFKTSFRVKKYPFTMESEFGVGGQFLPWNIVWRFVSRSPEFEERSFFNGFASISIIYSFEPDKAD